MGIVIKLFFNKHHSEMNAVLLQNTKKRNTVLADLKVKLDELGDDMIVYECKPEEALSPSDSEDSNSGYVTANRHVPNCQCSLVRRRLYLGPNDIPQNSSSHKGNHFVDGDINRNSSSRASKNRVDLGWADRKPYQLSPRSARHMKKMDAANDLKVAIDSEVRLSSSDSDSRPSISKHKRKRRCVRKKTDDTTNDPNVVTDSSKSKNKCKKTLTAAQNKSFCTSFDIEEEIMKENDIRRIFFQRNLTNSPVKEDLCTAVNNYEKSFEDGERKSEERYDPEDICKPTKFICSFCGRQFPNAPPLREHERTHTGEKPFSCTHTQCEYKCSSKANLMRHNRKHLNVKPYSCTICGHSTRLKSTLQQHIATHTGEKQFKCRYCNYRAVQQNNVRSHELSHSEEKPFVCNKCDYRTFTKGELVKHCRRHLNPKVLQCQHCAYKCLEKWTMSQHIQRYCQEFQELLQNHE